jgi:hypothetical protein
MSALWTIINAACAAAYRLLRRWPEENPDG